ncbi:MAG: aspartate kinase [Motiliproteus sp.]
MIVMKFGGSSLADRIQIDKVVQIVKHRSSHMPLIVCSAHKGVTTQLIDSAIQAARGEHKDQDALNRQQQICAELGCSESLLKPLYDELTALLHGISLVRELSDRTLDYVASFGERMSVRVIAWYLRQQGIQALPIDAWDLGLITDSEFGRSRPVKGRLSEAAKLIQELNGVIPVVTGFIGKDTEGNITTLGRNGSDLSATLFAEALQAERCEIWSDTNGVMSADPSLIANAHNIPQMSFREASELARFGSRILHPASLEPVEQARIPLWVMNTDAPEHPGTLISHDSVKSSERITSIAYKENQTIVTLTSSEMFQRAGFLAEVFRVLSDHQVVVDMVSTSEVSLSFSTESSPQLDQALQTLARLGHCKVANDKAIVAIVAPDHHYFLRHEVDVLRVLRDGQVDAEMLSLGYESINLMLLIDDHQIEKAISSLHGAFFNHIE